MENLTNSYTDDSNLHSIEVQDNVAVFPDYAESASHNLQGLPSTDADMATVEQSATELQSQADRFVGEHASELQQTFGTTDAWQNMLTDVFQTNPNFQSIPTERLESLRDDFIGGELRPQVNFVEPDVLLDAQGNQRSAAFDETNQTILLAKTSDSSAIQEGIEQEIGHWWDAQLHGTDDTTTAEGAAFDEGAAYAERFVEGVEGDSLYSDSIYQSDRYQLSLAGETVAVEFADDNRSLQELSREFAGDFTIGGKISPKQYDDPGYRDTANEEFNGITGTIYANQVGWKPDPNQELSDEINELTDEFKEIANWGKSESKLVHGHVLVYPQVNNREDMVEFRNLSNDEVKTELEEYVKEVVKNTNEKVDVWHVVNEAFGSDGSPVAEIDDNGVKFEQQIEGEMTTLKEYKAFEETEGDGAKYIDEAFNWANEVKNEDTKLIINETGAELVNAKSDYLYDYVKSMIDEGVPINGVGFQMHVNTNLDEEDIKSIEANFKRFDELGLDIYITEADVSIVNPGDNPIQGESLGREPNQGELDKQAEVFGDLLDLSLNTRNANKERIVDGFYHWDFADNSSWLEEYSPTPFSGGDGEPLEPKPAYEELQTAIKE